MNNLLARVRVVLIETSHPGNIGAVARAMKTMGLTELYLVKPRQFPHEEATARASGADDVLARAQHVETLDAAIAECSLVVGTSARDRKMAWPKLNPREMASKMLAMPGDRPVALVFGRERTGLTNEELERCHFLVQIPANPDYSSLNIAAAVQVLCYELRVAAELSQGEQNALNDEALADAADVERMMVHLEETLVHIEFLDPDNPKLLMRRLRRLFARTQLLDNEVNILRGILTAVMRKSK